MWVRDVNSEASTLELVLIVNKFFDDLIDIALEGEINFDIDLLSYTQSFYITPYKTQEVERTIEKLNG